MVNWYLIEETDKHIRYEYYPESDKDKQPGIITIDRIADKIELTKPADADFESYAEEFNERWYYYFSHAEKHIASDYNSGIIKKSGMTAWY